MLPNARIPYGTWGSSYFPSWQASALAEVNIGQFAGEAMNRILGVRGVSTQHLEALVLGSTVPWHLKFWTAPLLAAIAGKRVPGYHCEQACATGLQAIMLAAAEVEQNDHQVVGVLTFDRCSDSPVGVFPERRAHRRTVPIADVWDNFGCDPTTGKGMLNTAGAAARKYKLDRREVDDLTVCRYEQYFEAKARGFLDKVLVPLDVLDTRGKKLGTIDEDLGVRMVDRASLAGMRELDTCVTSGTQTHPADGMATLLVAHKDRVAELSPRPEVDIRILGKATVRTKPVLMPEAPALAVQKLLAATGASLDDVVVVKDHNPFAVNDAVFAKVFSYDWKEMNRTGCSLVWGHPQGPTLTRVTIEALEEAVELGGGKVLVFGCAAGDVGIAALLEVA